MASRAAGYGGSPALETEFDKLGANGRTDEALAGMAPWGKLILPDSAKALLITPNTDFEHFQNSSGWYIRRVQYHVAEVANLGQPSSCNWSVDAAFNSSTIGVRVRALPGIVAAGSPDDIDLLALGSSKVHDVSRTIGCHGGAAWCRTSLPVRKWQHEGDLGENSFRKHCYVQPHASTKDGGARCNCTCKLYLGR